MNEARAITLCIKHRDPIGFEFLVRKYRREAYGHALALLANPDDAAEACQDSFTSAFASLPRLNELTAFYPWFYRILRNRCLNFLSRRRTATDYARTEATRQTEAAPSPESITSSEQDSASVRAALSSLQLEFREILALKYMRGYDYNTLSALIGIPRGTVMSRLYHARKAFQAAYAEQTGDQAAINGERNHG